MVEEYTHDPDAFDEDDQYRPPDGSTEHSDELPAGESRDDADVHGADPAAVDRSFDWRGWLLVAAIVVAFLVIPGVLVAFPYVGPRAGLGFRDAYLVLPLAPAVALGLLAIWATTRP